MMENNDTPRTNRATIQLHGKRLATGGWYVEAEDAREIERDLNAARTELAALKARLAETEEDAASYLKTIGLIREAIGDNGKRMLPELVDYCRELAKKGGGK